MTRYEGRVKLVLYPFALNSRSEIATQLAMCAGEQDKFWQVNKMLFEHQGEWNQLSDPLEQLLTLSRAEGLDTEAMQAFASRLAKTQVEMPTLNQRFDL